MWEASPRPMLLLYEQEYLLLQRLIGTRPSTQVTMPTLACGWKNLSTSDFCFVLFFCSFSGGGFSIVGFACFCFVFGEGGTTNVCFDTRACCI